MANGSQDGAAGTWRFDGVTVSGQVIAVPEPETPGLLLAGLGGVALLARRRRA